MSAHRSISRRIFLKQTAILAPALAVATAAPCILPASALGLSDTVAPSERIALGLVGAGPRSRDVVPSFLAEKDVQWIAICDVQKQKRDAAKLTVDKHYGNASCATFNDFREMYARPDLDAVYIATGVHWHGLLSIYAARAGKDIYSEKPCTMNVVEGRALVDTMKRLGTVYQAGHQRRSVDSFRFMADVVRRGMIGKVQRVIMTCWEGPAIKPDAVKPVPDGFDYEMWLGWTPWHPYTDARVRQRTYFWDTGGGVMLDMGAHWTDMAQFVLQRDHTLPLDYEGEADFDRTAFSETPLRGQWRATYADGIELVMKQTGGFDDRYIRFEGTEGWIQIVDGTNAVTASPASILRTRNISSVGWGDAGNHVRNFLDCVKSRNPRTVCHPESAHRATVIGHIWNLDVRLGRKLTFDPVAERFVNDPEADRMLAMALREPWRL